MAAPTIEPALFAMATNAGGFTWLTPEQQAAAAQLADLIDDRAYPGFIPRGTVYPQVCYACISGVPDRHLASRAIRRARYQFTCWSNDRARAAAGYDEAKEVADLLIKTLDGFRGTVRDMTIRGLHVQDSDDIGGIDAALDDAHISGRRVDVMVTYTEEF